MVLKVNHGFSSAALSEAALTADMTAPLTHKSSILASPWMVVPAGEATEFLIYTRTHITLH